MTQKPNYESILRQAGLRITRQRRIILTVLSSTQDHLDALEIFRRVREVDVAISLSTVYRTMKVLGDRGAIHRHVFHDGLSRFEHADSEHHDHLIDIDSGNIIEFRSDLIENLQAEIAQSLGYDIVHHRLEIYGKKRDKN